MLKKFISWTRRTILRFNRRHQNYSPMDYYDDPAYTNRKDHILRPLKKVTRMHRCVYLDTETDRAYDGDVYTRDKLVLGWACATRRRTNGAWTKGHWYPFHAKHAFWNWLVDQCPPKTTTYVWAHNTDYDMCVLGIWTELGKRGYQITTAIIDSPPYIVIATNGEHKLIFTDLFNLYSTALDQLAQIFDDGKGNWDDVKNDYQALSDYCKQDVTITRRLVEAHYDNIDKRDLGPHKLTAASQAFATFRYRALKHDIRIDAHSGALRLARGAYYGGATDALQLGHVTEILHTLDINQMYPYVMHKYLFPARLVGYRENVPLRLLRRLLGQFLCVAEVELTTDDPRFPFRTKSRLVFPLGRFKTILSTPELQYALSEQKVHSCSKIAFYEADPLFKEYVDLTHQMRLEAKKEGDDLYDRLAKLLSNSFYGKWGQTGVVWERVRRTTEIGLYNVDQVLPLYGARPAPRRVVGDAIQEKIRNPESTYSHPAIASHITAYARMNLFDLIDLAGRENVWYHDTDSVVTNEIGLSRLQELIHPTKLGALKLEKTILDGVIYAPKDYRFDAQVKLKGIKRRAAKVDDNTYIQTQWLGSKHRLQNADPGEPTQRLIVKKLARQYKKGKVDRSGRTRPFHLPRDLRLLDL